MAKPRDPHTTDTTKSVTSNGMLSRRALLQSVIAASAAAAFPATKAVAGTIGDRMGRLADREAALLTRVLDRLIPSDGVMPGAGEIGVTQFINDLVVEAPHLHRPVADVLGSVGAADSAAATDEQMDAALRRAERDHPEAFGMLVHAAYVGYYNHPEVLDAIGWVSPEASSNEPKYFDDSRLAGVRGRRPVYKHV